MENHLDEEKKRIIFQTLWDMNMSPEEFLGIIEVRIVRKWPDFKKYRDKGIVHGR